MVGKNFLPPGKGLEKRGCPQEPGAKKGKNKGHKGATATGNGLGCQCTEKNSHGDVQSSGEKEEKKNIPHFSRSKKRKWQGSWEKPLGQILDGEATHPQGEVVDEKGTKFGEEDGKWLHGSGKQDIEGSHCPLLGDGTHG
jgi:hypothetical protein